jgi:hypothetical protein
MTEDVYHHGIKGMHWGIRKEDPSGDSNPERRAKVKKAAIILGSAVGVAAIAAGTYYMTQHGGVSMSDVNRFAESKAAEPAKKFTSSMAREPLGIVHAAKPKNRGFTFPQRGGLDDPIHEYERSGVAHLAANTFKRYGSRNEKIAAKFSDPEGRRDRAGRPIDHDVMLPESLASGIKDFAEIVPKVWPLIKDTYAAIYDSDPNGD